MNSRTRMNSMDDWIAIDERIVKVKGFIAEADAKGDGDFAHLIAAISLKSHLNDLYEIREKQGEYEIREKQGEYEIREKQGQHE